MTKVDKAVLLAAGRGTRMRELTADLPKPMIEVRGKPVLQHIVEGLRDAGVRRFLIIVGYRADAVKNFFGDGARYKIDIQYATQITQDGTGRVGERFCICSGLRRHFGGARKLQTPSRPRRRH
jgi:NDP-sugar pyrophosphorylase family protein